MEKTKRNWLLTGLLAMLMLFGLCLCFGLGGNQVQTVYATGDEPPPFVGDLGDGCTVSFEPNGGTGTMTAEKISGSYTLPDCTFTPPSGKQFLCWAEYSTTGTQYNSGTQYNVYNSVTFYAIWEDVPKEFTSVPSNATKQVGQTFTATWTVNFDTTEYYVLVWDDEWNDYISIYDYDDQTIPAGTQMSYDITSDVAGEKRYTIDCFYDYWHYETSDEFVITWEAAPADELAGTVAINGNLKFGATLTASLTNTNNTGTLSYQWRRNGSEIAEATNNTYTLTQDDIGYTMSVVVSSNVETGSLVATATEIVAKADGPVAPTGITATACTTNANNNGTLVGITAEMEYKLSTNEIWTDGTGATITGLNNGTYLVRLKETATHNAGEQVTVVVNAYNAPLQYGITVNKGTSSANTAVAGTTITITANAPETGYVFDKWTSTDGVVFTDENNMATTFNMPSKNVTVTATYQLMTLSITFNANGGTGTKASVQVSYGNNYTLPVNPFTAPEGKEFDGWALSANGEKITAAQITITEDTQLFALWKEVVIPEYDLTVVDGGENTYPQQEGVTVMLHAMGKVGHNFVRWTSGDVVIASPENESIEFIMPAKAVRVEAVYEAIVFTVTFNSNGGTGTQEPANVEYGNYVLPVGTTFFTPDEGKVFDGWALSANGAKIDGTTINITENTELFALWKDAYAPVDPEEPEVEPDANGGISAGAVVAIVLAVTVVGGVGGFALVWFVIKKKKWADFVALFKKK